MIAIRAATARDARAIAEVHVASWRWAYRDALSTATLDALDVDERERAWSERLNEPRAATAETVVAETVVAETVVAENDGAVVGFCGYGPSRDDDASPGTGEVYAIYLLEEIAGRGVGRELCVHANRRLHALGYRSVTAWVLESNVRARRFYEAAGWTVDGGTDSLPIGDDTHAVVRYRVGLLSGGRT